MHVVDADHAAAALDLARGLVSTTPSGCAVDAIVPAGAEVPITGVSEVRTLSLARRELAASWQMGIAPGVGGGLIHSATLMAPLVRHDRVHDNDQTVVTLWDLRAWDAADSMQRNAVAWHRAMLRRAAKHADAIVVPSHAVAERLGELAKFGGRIRVIAGAPPADFETPADVDERRSALSLPERYVLLTGSRETLTEGFRGAVAAGVEAVVLDAAEGTEPALAEIASAAGLPESRVHVRGGLSPEDRAAVFSAASVFAATDPIHAWPWRAVEAMALGIPIVAVDSGSHRDVIADGGMLVPQGEIAEAIGAASGSSRLSVLAQDRSRAFSWASAAERVWGLHAEL